MRNRSFALVYGAMLTFAMAHSALAQDGGAKQPSARQQLQRLHTPQSIDQKLTQLTKRSGVDSGTAETGPAFT
jgi:hypothetical protein